jgi:uncharacterized Zn-binding protein involved in type VI secretion
MTMKTRRSTQDRSPLAARVGDSHRCRFGDPVPHVGGGILEGCPTVVIDGEPAARVGDIAWCEGAAYDAITGGEPTVSIGGKPAARRGDATDGGSITSGCATVTIGRRSGLRSRRRGRAGQGQAT